MIKTAEQISKRRAMIGEYLMGGVSYHTLGKKYGVDPSDLCKWVRMYQGQTVRKKKETIPFEGALKLLPLPTDVKQLQEELRKARLHNELLNAMIDIAEGQLKIDIRKKSGPKR